MELLLKGREPNDGFGLEVGADFLDSMPRRLVMTGLTVRQILDAMKRGMEETWRKIDRGELRQDGRLDWPDRADIEDKVAFEKNRPASEDMTIREILDAMTQALDEVARRFAEQKPDQMSGRTPHQRTE